MKLSSDPEEILFLAAVKAFEDGHLDRARTLFQHVVDLEGERQAEARRYLELMSDPEEHLFAAAVQAYEAGDLERASRLFQQLLALEGRRQAEAERYLELIREQSPATDNGTRGLSEVASAGSGVVNDPLGGDDLFPIATDSGTVVCGSCALTVRTPASRSPSMSLSRMPAASASGARTGSPPAHISAALARPTSRGRRCVPPAAGMRPSCTSGWPIRTAGDDVATRQSHASAIS